MPLSQQIEETKQTTGPITSPINFAVSRKAILFLKHLTEKRPIFGAVLSGDNKDADIME
jgi:hypothetical protein